MGEHVLRYSDLANTLVDNGFIVYGQDHRGHGATADSDAALGRLGTGGWAELVHDIGLLVTHARTQNPGLPLVLLSHSMGSFAVQQYLPDHSDRVDAAVLTGTTALDMLEPVLDLSQPLKLSALNLAFVPARTDFDWLSRDDAQVDRYLADPDCGFGLDSVAVNDMFAAARPLADPKRLTAIRPDLPIYIAIGDADPINGGLALAAPLADRYRNAGVTDVQYRTYPGARHELFNETNRTQVITDLLIWLDRVTPTRQL